MKPRYAVVQCGVSVRHVRGIFTVKSTAIAEAIRLAREDRDDWHDYKVVHIYLGGTMDEGWEDAYPSFGAWTKNMEGGEPIRRDG